MHHSGHKMKEGDVSIFQVYSWSNWAVGRSTTTVNYLFRKVPGLIRY